MVRVLKPRGVVILAVPNYWNPHTFYRWFKGENYEYGFEKSFRVKELRGLADRANLEVIAVDGFCVAYPFYRHRSRLVRRLVGRAIDILVKTLDVFSNRYFSKHFGFEICLVAAK